MSDAPEPHEIFRRMREEGRDRLGRTRLELAASSLVAGFDIVFGVIALSAADAAATPHFGTQFAHLIGALAFGIAFIFITMGRSELFTENFMVPVTGLEQGAASKLKLAQLWLLSPVFNILGGTVLILILTTHGVLPTGAGTTLKAIAVHFDSLDTPTAFASAVAGGALITLMTWLVEGSPTAGGRILVAWIAGMLLTLGSFDHVIVVTLEMIFGNRFGAGVPWGDVAQNFGIAAAGNMVGGLAFVTLTRTSQAIGSSEGEEPIEDGPPAAA
ncbi:MAG: formate-nitrite transporter family protein [Solirubrobacteraceae bacterium]|nr:formate-nitrite transporter family protein [Solirubrobacteraceae bacterium]